VLRRGAGHDTLLIDADEQASAMDFTRHAAATHREPGYTAIQTHEAVLPCRSADWRPSMRTS